ncbi:hypothetical protein LTR60_000263 [Cryomyces antarcticus]|nr:hypothetical protein LTR60_000263 [Cryomyces antarcticus]
MIEEAAETLEAPVIATCLPSLEHLILVGDHQQLRPHCHNKEYEDEPWNLNVSLFERLVKNEVEFSTLSRQRRMIPEIRRILKPIYGNLIKDHPSVEDSEVRPSVPGMGGVNSFFFSHAWPESRDNYMSSVNHKEAEMIVGFFDHLVYNGMQAKDITVLTFYNGQRKVLLNALRNHPNLQSSYFNVVTVDSYQGEENDVVLLSLVRSNSEGKIGFLSVENRVCVALSRAQRGLYIFGNSELLCGESNAWTGVVKIMAGMRGEIPKNKPKARLGFALPLTCTQHNKKTFIEDPDDWGMINGGCERKCKGKLPCGHECKLQCHPNLSPVPSTASSGLESWNSYAKGGVIEDDAARYYAALERENKYVVEQSRQEHKKPQDDAPTLPFGYDGAQSALVDSSLAGSPWILIPHLASPPLVEPVVNELGDTRTVPKEKPASEHISAPRVAEPSLLD